MTIVMVIKDEQSPLIIDNIDEEQNKRKIDQVAVQATCGVC
jgi:hypothetical protein